MFVISTCLLSVLLYILTESKWGHESQYCSFSWLTCWKETVWARSNWWRMNWKRRRLKCPMWDVEWWIDKQIGLNDGLSRGFEEQFQVLLNLLFHGKTGFNEGFMEGDAFGKCIGIIDASIKWLLAIWMMNRILDLCFKNPSVENDIRGIGNITYRL